MTAVYNKVGVAMHESVEPAALKYMTERGHTMKSMRTAGFRFLNDTETIQKLFPGSFRGSRKANGVTVATNWYYFPKWAIILPFDESYAVARVEYDILSEGKGKGPGKYQNPGGDTRPFIPKSASRKDLLDPSKTLYLVEAPFKAVVAAAHGLLCVGVCGHPGAFKNETHCTEIRPELHEYLLPGREVIYLTDADVRSNLEVRKSQINFMHAAAECGCNPMFVELPALDDGKTGIDDYFASGATLKDFHKLQRHPRDSTVVKELGCALMGLTQLGLADRFVALHGGDCRHDTRIEQWFTYTGAGYQSGEVEPRRRIVEVVRGLSAETAAAHGDEIKKRKKFKDECEQKSTINGALGFAADDPLLEIDAAKFDADQDLIGVQDGVLRLSDGKLLKPSRELMVTKRVACGFDPKAKAPMWQKFIARIAGGNRELVGYLQEIAGACLAGRSARQEVFFLYGSGSNGKSVFIETLTRLLGDYAVTIPARVLLRAQKAADGERATPFLITLHGARLATCSELSENMPIDEAVLKDLNGGDLISGRENYGNAFQFRNTARMLVRCNHLPVVTGTDKAVWDRIRAVPFTTTIPDAEQDAELAAKIAAAELPGILAWAHVGFMRLAARDYKFETPKVVLELTAKHRSDSDVLGTWLTESVLLDPLKSGSKLRELQTEVTKDYTDWAHRNNHQVLSSKTLWSKLRERVGFDPIYRGDGGVAYARSFTLRRNPIAESLIKIQIDEILKRDAEITQLKADLAAAKGTTRTTQPTSSGKRLFRLVEGGKP